jgi:hypothetical protein
MHQETDDALDKVIDFTKLFYLKQMEVICLQDEAFYQLVEDVVDRLKEKKNITQDKCISPELAMEILNIKNKTTLQKL